MELSDFVGQPCRTQLAFEFFPKKKVELDLKKISQNLEKNFLVDLKTPVFLGVVVEKTSASVFKDGKILVKDTKNRLLAEKIAQKILAAINEDEGSSNKIP